MHHLKPLLSSHPRPVNMVLMRGFWFPPLVSYLDYASYWGGGVSLYIQETRTLFGNRVWVIPRGLTPRMGQGCLGGLYTDVLGREAGPRLGGQVQVSICHSDCKLSLQLLWCL